MSLTHGNALSVRTDADLNVSRSTGDDMRVALLMPEPITPSQNDEGAEQEGGCGTKLNNLIVSQPGNGVKSRFARLGCCCLIAASVVANVGLGSALMIMMNSNESYSPLPPPAPNSSSYDCPFSPADTVDGPQSSLTGLGSDYVSLCWNDFAATERGHVAEPYQVKISDPWLGEPDSEPLTVYQGRASSFNATELLPASKYRVTVTSQQENGPETSVEIVTKERGFCGNAADVQVYKDTKKTMKPDIQGCLIKHIMSDDDIATCINQKVGLSLGCSKCWVAEAHCTIKYCASPCLNPTSKKCQDCSEQKCFPDCVKCSGMPQWSFP